MISVIDTIEPGAISRAIRECLNKCEGPAAGADLRKTIKFLSDQMLAAGYSDLN